jgi:hypothetical protein
VRRTIANVAAWTGLTILLGLIVMLGEGTGMAAQGLAALSILLLTVHAVLALGWTEAAIFAAICLTITFAVENLGATTGFPFGRYAFLVDAGLPRVGAIPIIVGPLYFGMGYASWVIANLLVGPRVERPQHPSGSTLGKAWAWFNGGGYFGVPLSNFLGWLLVTWLYFQVFAIFAYARRTRAAHPARSRVFWVIPILIYLAAGLCHLPPLAAHDVTLVDAGGRTWSAADLRETAAIVMLFTMAPTSILALSRLALPLPPRSGSDRAPVGLWSGP